MDPLKICDLVNLSCYTNYTNNYSCSQQRDTDSLERVEDINQLFKNVSLNESQYLNEQFTNRFKDIIDSLVIKEELNTLIRLAQIYPNLVNERLLMKQQELKDMSLEDIKKWVEALVITHHFNPKVGEELIPHIALKNDLDLCPLLQRLIDLKCPLPIQALGWSSTKEAFCLLLDHGAPVNDYAFMTALELDCSFDVIEKMKAKNAGFIPSCALNTAINLNKKDIIQCLLEANVRPDDKSIYYATKIKDLDLIKTLIQKKAPLAPGCLEHVIASQDLGLLQFLIDQGAQLTEEDFRYLDNLPTKVLNYCLEKQIAFPSTLIPRAIGVETRELFETLLTKATCVSKEAVRGLWCFKKIDADEALERVKLLLSKGATFTLSDIDVLLTHSHVKVATYLLQEKMNQQDEAFFKKTKSKINLKNLLKIKYLDLIDQCLEMNLVASRFNLFMLTDQELNLIAPYLQKMLKKDWQIDLDQEQLLKFVMLSKEINIDNQENLIDIIGQAVYLQRTYSIEPKEALLYSLKPNEKIWNRLYPDFKDHRLLYQFSPYGFKPKLYQELFILTSAASLKEQHNLSVEHAYKLSVLFDSKEEALSYIKRFENKNRPYHDACLFDLPKQGVWCIPTWRNIMKNAHFKMNRMVFLRLVSDLELKIQNGLPSLEQARLINQAQVEQALKAIEEKYQRADCALSLEEEATLREIAKKQNKDLTCSEEKIYQKLKQKKLEEKQGKMSLLFQQEKLSCEKQQMALFYQKRIKKAYKATGQSLSLLEFCEQSYPVLYNLFKEDLRKAYKVKSFKTFVDFVIECKDVGKQSHQHQMTMALKVLYQDVEEVYQPFAMDCLRSGIAKESFNKAIKILKKPGKPYELIPSIKIEGASIGYPGHVFETMSSKDPLIFILGKKTSCCQSIDEHSSDAVLHGAKSPYGAFFRLIKTTTKKEEELTWIAQSWAGITEENELVFDSIEHNIGYDPDMIMAFYQQAAKEILNKQPLIKKVLFGGGGNTPKNKVNFPLMEKKPYSPIIGYKEIGYDSKEERYLLAELEFGSSHLYFFNQQDVVSFKGKDTYLSVGKTQKGLAINPLKRQEFFKAHPRAYQALMKHDKNPLVEEGYYSKTNRERIGEMFITSEMIQTLIAQKMKHAPTQYQFDFQVYADNDSSALAGQLQEINLQEGQTIFICCIEGVHAITGYVEKKEGQILAALLDPETPSHSQSLIYKGVMDGLHPDKIISFTAKLQIDYYSCSTFAINAFSYLGQYGKTLFEAINQPDYLEERQGIFYLKASYTPARLLKISQSQIVLKGSKAAASKYTIEVEEEVYNQVVSEKKNQTLGQYIQSFQIETQQRVYNSSALLRKYKYLHQYEKNCVNK